MHFDVRSPKFFFFFCFLLFLSSLVILLLSSNALFLLRAFFFKLGKKSYYIIINNISLLICRMAKFSSPGKRCRYQTMGTLGGRGKGGRKFIIEGFAFLFPFSFSFRE